MCLYVVKSSMSNPVPSRKVTKLLEISTAWGHYFRKGVYTPFQGNLVVFGDGYFVAKDYQPSFSELEQGDVIYGGYLHAKTKYDHYADYNGGKEFPLGAYAEKSIVSFSATALDVCAIGESDDLVCRSLYIPAMDIRNYTDERLRDLEKAYPASFTKHTNEVLSALGR